MKSLLLLVTALFLTGLYRRFLYRDCPKDKPTVRELARRCRWFLRWTAVILTASTVLFLGFRMGMLGMTAALWGMGLLAGGFFVGLMKLRAWLS
ncbi:hypothetical protein [Salinithrix halophila]|uniref:YtpI-like protein n=1 Tax=Salinithrix halophila TaxID=1485204 RepID=A0ABV8JGI8_9BACL